MSVLKDLLAALLGGSNDPSCCKMVIEEVPEPASDEPVPAPAAPDSSKRGEPVS
ncbi:hypothetical protein [Azospirillum sp.]|uniref:hypothetical protein n=1 Tax=Azospirillum sp. TaxID=34012 RepID=UPI003D7129F4